MALALGDFDALTFDCYGTIVDWETGILRALRGLRAAPRAPRDDDSVLAAFAAAEATEEHAPPGAPYPEILRRVHSRLAAEFGAGPAPEAAAAFAGSVGDWPPFPDSVEALRSLERSHLLAILSNVDRASFARTEARLGVKFGLVMTAEEIGSYKPDPRNFRYALDQLGARGIPPARVLHVAQSLFHDHVPAKALGLRTVWVDRRAGRRGGAVKEPPVPVEPDLVVPDLRTLAAMPRPRRAR
jgi:2-haloalkanoic acid dehalogenase type II